jgi:hypothetical protein
MPVVGKVLKLTVSIVSFLDSLVSSVQNWI